MNACAQTSVAVRTNFGSRSPRQGRMREKFESLRPPPGTQLGAQASQNACIAVTAHPPYHQAAVWVHDGWPSAIRARAVALRRRLTSPRAQALGVPTWRLHAAATESCGHCGRQRELCSLGQFFRFGPVGCSPLRFVCPGGFGSALPPPLLMPSRA